MKIRALAFVLLAVAPPAWAEYDDYRDGRIRLAEPGVTLQRASEAGAEEAEANLPLLPGDRVWTDFSGRAEFQFADGSVLRLDTRSKLDYVAHDDARGGDVVALSLWSGSLILHLPDSRSRSDFEIDTPEGRVEVRSAGVLRVDVARGELRLSVFDGEAVIVAGRREETVGRGQRSYASRGEAPSRPERFDDWGEEDAFARWDRDQGDPLVWTGDSRRYLPDEVLPYASDFERHGTWHVEVEVGYVWRPRVASGWRPYFDGRWVWTAWGWTWVPYESWGWAPFHYGRWGHSVALGWYWIPDRRWGPAWVSWAVGGDYVGWCPLGWRNRPVWVGRHRGHAVPRGQHHLGGSNAWTYAHRDRLGVRDVARRRVDVAEPHLRTLRVVDSDRSRLTKDLRPVDADSTAAPRGAVPRHVRARPTPGDSVPELRADPKVTIPDAAARRGIPRDDDRLRRYDRDDTAVGRDDRALPSRTERTRAPDPTARVPRADQEVGTDERPVTRRRAPEWTRPVERPVERDETPRARPVRPPEPSEPTARRGGAPSDDDRGATSRERSRRGDDSDVLRRFFRPLSEPSSRGRDDDAPRARPREREADREPQVRERPREERPAWRPRDGGSDEGRRGGDAPRAEPRERQPRSEGSGARRGGGDGGGRRGGGEGGGATRRAPRGRD